MTLLLTSSNIISSFVFLCLLFVYAGPISMTDWVGEMPVEIYHEVEGDFTLVAMVFQLNGLTTKISDVDDQWRL